MRKDACEGLCGSRPRQPATRRRKITAEPDRMGVCSKTHLGFERIIFYLNDKRDINIEFNSRQQGFFAGRLSQNFL
jgi:hypothetical protein